MKVVILAGGLGSRISEETYNKPKPMVTIGDTPIIVHIMRYFSSYGFNDFIICLGYKGYVLKEYFSNYFLHQSDTVIDLKKNTMTFRNRSAENWKIHLIDTGKESQTGGRLKRVQEFIDTDDFFFTYGDGLTDADLLAEVAFHQSHGKQATVLAVAPPGRFGRLSIVQNQVSAFEEKPLGDGQRINGGYFILKKDVLNMISGDATIWEANPLHTLAKNNNLMAFMHDGFWHPMDTLRDKNYLEKLVEQGKAPWIK